MVGRVPLEPPVMMANFPSRERAFGLLFRFVVVVLSWVGRYVLVVVWVRGMGWDGMG
jgi:hypothetical protein